jgi:hypothetical protein
MLLGLELEMGIEWRRCSSRSGRRRGVESSTRMSQDRDGYIRPTLARARTRPAKATGFQAPGQTVPIPTPVTAIAATEAPIPTPNSSRADTPAIDRRPHRRRRNTAERLEPFCTYQSLRKKGTRYAKSILTKFILTTRDCVACVPFEPLIRRLTGVEGLKVRLSRPLQN